MWVSFVLLILSEMEEKSKGMCIRGFHVYKDVWDAVVGEELECERERRNNYD